MTKTTTRSLRLLPPAAAALVLLFAQAAYGQKSPGRHEGAAAAEPILLGDITVEHQLHNDAGQLVWRSSKSDNPNAIEIQSGALRLRLTAAVKNRVDGSRVRLRAALHEVCRSKDRGKQYITRLRHLTESDAHGDRTGEKTDDELRVVEAGKVSIELPVHCPDCVRAECENEGCEGKDHLGEGPHVVIVTTSDPPPSDPPPGPQTAPASRTAGPTQAVSPARLSSYRVDLMSKCPKPGEGKAGTKKPGR